MTIDQQLRAALDVEPSPGFVAGVRSRIASEPAPGRGWSPWLLPAAGLVAAAVVVAVFVQGPAPAGGRPSAIASRALPSIVVPVIEQRMSSDSASIDPKVAPPTAVVAQPVVLIDPRETAALRRLIAGSQSNRPAPATWLLPSPLAIAEPAAMSDLEIPEIVIEALPIGSEGVRQ